MKRRIDFLTQLAEQGFIVRLPHEVIEELKDLRQDARREEREAIDIAFQLFERAGLKEIKLGKMSVDQGLIHKGKEGYYIATLDREIKRAVPKKVVIFSATQSVGAE